MRRGLWAVALLALGLAGGCSSDDSSSPSGSQNVCAPGKSEACTGPGGCAGGQVCKSDGTGYEACVCADAGGVVDAGPDAVADAEAGSECGVCPKGTACRDGGCETCGPPIYTDSLCGNTAAFFCPLDMPLNGCKCSPSGDGKTLRCCCV